MCLWITSVVHLVQPPVPRRCTPMMLQVKTTVQCSEVLDEGMEALSWYSSHGIQSDRSGIFLFYTISWLSNSLISLYIFWACSCCLHFLAVQRVKTSKFLFPSTPWGGTVEIFSDILFYYTPWGRHHRYLRKSISSAAHGTVRAFWVLDVQWC